MSKLVINRILGQKRDFYSRSTIIQKRVVEIIEPLTVNELRTMLEQELVDKSPAVTTVTTEIRFENLFAFCDWYVQHVSEFNSKQNEALSTLIRARDAINIGCNCTRPNRERGAREYFSAFWKNNFHTDIMPAVLKIAGANKAFIGDFLIYPA